MAITATVQHTLCDREIADILLDDTEFFASVFDKLGSERRDLTEVKDYMTPEGIAFLRQLLAACEEEVAP